MDCELRDREGSLVPVVRVSGLKLRRGGREVLERLPLYRGVSGEWYVEQRLIREYLKEDWNETVL